MDLCDLGPVLQRVTIDPNQSQVLQSITSLQSPISYVHSCDWYQLFVRLGPVDFLFLSMMHVDRSLVPWLCRITFFSRNHTCGVCFWDVRSLGHVRSKITYHLNGNLHFKSANLENWRKMGANLFQLNQGYPFKMPYYPSAFISYSDISWSADDFVPKCWYGFCFKIVGII